VEIKVVQYSGDLVGTGKNNIVKIYGLNGLIHNQLAWARVPQDSINLNYKKNMNSITDRDTFNQNLIILNWVNYQKSNIRFNTSAYFDNVNGHYYSTLPPGYTTNGLLFGVNSYQVGVMSNMVVENEDYNFNLGLNINDYNRKHTGQDSLV
jgi:lipopolysaccharide export LptBFGC system permease protein LptF